SHLLRSIKGDRQRGLLPPERARPRCSAQAEARTLGRAGHGRSARVEPAGGPVVARGVSRRVSEARVALRSRGPWKGSALARARAGVERESTAVVGAQRRSP